MKTNPFIGSVFGRLTVVSYLYDNKYNCRCTCGVVKPVYKGALTAGHTRSCGCLARETTAARNRKQTKGRAA